MGLLFSATCYFFLSTQELSYEQPVCLLSPRFYVSERPPPPSLNAENKSISSAVVLFRSLFSLFPFRPVSTKPYGSWEKERNELCFQTWTKGAMVSELPMNAWDTVMCRRAWSPSGRTKGKADRAATAYTEKHRVFSLFMSPAFIHSHLYHIPSQSLWCQNSISYINDIWLEGKSMWRDKKGTEWAFFLLISDICIPRCKNPNKDHVHHVFKEFRMHQSKELIKYDYMTGL